MSGGASGMATSERDPLRADERPPVTLPLPNWLAYAIAGVSVASTVVLPFALASGDLSLTEAVGGYYLLSAALFAVLGALILRQRPGHAVGWILVGIGGWDTLTRLVDEYELFGLADRAGFPSLATVELLSWTWVPLIAGIMIWLPLLFPDGRLLSRRWRPLVWFGAVATTLLSLTFLIDADGYEPLVGVGFAVFLSATLASSVPFVLRFRRSRGVERQQFKWVFYGLAVSIPMLVVGTAGTWLGALMAVWAIPPLVILPVFIAVAVLRYRLYDVDVVISRTLLVAGPALPVRVNAEGVGRYAPEVEAAAYFAVLECLQNVAKYANATSARVRLSQHDNQLTFEVVDDGAGFDTGTTTLGTGLQGITDRLDTVNGTLTITSTSGRGTAITGHIPTPSAATAAPEPIPELAGATR